MDKIINKRFEELDHYISWVSHVMVNNAFGGNMRKGSFDQYLYSRHQDHLLIGDEYLIPKMVHPLSKYWNQPDQRRIYLSGEYAEMDRASFNALCNYSTSIPTGAYIGKMWKRQQDKIWWLCWFSEHSDPNLLTINMKEIKLLPEANYLYMYDEKRTLIIEDHVSDFQYYKALQKEQQQALIKLKK